MANPVTDQTPVAVIRRRTVTHRTVLTVEALAQASGQTPDVVRAAVEAGTINDWLTDALSTEAGPRLAVTIAATESSFEQSPAEVTAYRAL